MRIQGRSQGYKEPLVLLWLVYFGTLITNKINFNEEKSKFKLASRRKRMENKEINI
jgi:hypothetical protein